MRSGRRRGKERQAEQRAKPKLKIGVDIPTREEIKAIVSALHGQWRALLLTAILRACAHQNCVVSVGQTLICQNESCMFASVPTNTSTSDDPNQGPVGVPSR